MLTLRKFQQLRKLPLAHYGPLCMALLLLPITAVLLRLIGFKNTTHLLMRLSPDTPAGSIKANDKARQLARLVAIAANHGPYGGNCLKRSLTLWTLLRYNGIASELRIGTRKSDGRFEAHAWVECDGNVLNDSHDVHTRYAAFESPVLVEGVHLR
jgi:hypothetical protein